MNWPPKNDDGRGRGGQGRAIQDSRHPNITASRSLTQVDWLRLTTWLTIAAELLAVLVLGLMAWWPV